jgi:hypothetical protein
MALKTLFLLFIALAPICPAAESVVPQGYAPERYERIWKKSPFTVASVIVEKPVDNTTFADSLTLVGLVTIGGKPLVTVVSNDSQETTLVDADQPNAAGLQVVSFVNNLDPSKVEVVLKKGDVNGTLRFTTNETPTSQPPNEQANNAPNIQPPRRIIQPRVNPAGGAPIPTPSNARVVPRTNAPGMAMPNNGNGAPIIRRRQLQLPGTNQPNQPNKAGGRIIPPP